MTPKSKVDQKTTILAVFFDNVRNVSKNKVVQNCTVQITSEFFYFQSKEEKFPRGAIWQGIDLKRVRHTVDNTNESKVLDRTLIK